MHPSFCTDTIIRPAFCVATAPRTLSLGDWRHSTTAADILSTKVERPSSSGKPNGFPSQSAKLTAFVCRAFKSSAITAESDNCPPANKALQLAMNATRHLGFIRDVKVAEGCLELSSNPAMVPRQIADGLCCLSHYKEDLPQILTS